MQPVQLSIGSGKEQLEGWIRVDANPEVKPDIVARAERLDMFADGSVDRIECCHLLEHLTYDEALCALREWWRVLRAGGVLELELPDLNRCFALLGRHFDPKGFDLAMVGIYGWPPAIREEGLWQVHKWGWTPETLGEELGRVGFVEVAEEPVRQTWRRATAIGRDMRLRAVKVTSVKVV